MDIDGLQPCTQLWENVGETPAIEPICCTAATTRSSLPSLWEVEWRHTLSCFFFIVHTKESSLPPLCIFNNRFPPFYIYVAKSSLATATITHVLPPGLRSLSSINVFKRGCYWVTYSHIVRLLLRNGNQQNILRIIIYLVCTWQTKCENHQLNWEIVDGNCDIKETKWKYAT